jgi:hypothetical protein
MNVLRVSLFAMLLSSFGLQLVAQNPSVLLVSIDGLRPDHILKAGLAVNLTHRADVAIGPGEGAVTGTSPAN